MFSGGAFANATIFALGIMPYISSSIIFSLLVVVVPALEALQKAGAEGQKKINEYTRFILRSYEFHITRAQELHVALYKEKPNMIYQEFSPLQAYYWDNLLAKTAFVSAKTYIH